MVRQDIAILKFLAGRHDGCRDLVDIFRGVMDPNPVDPGRWRAMCSAIEGMEGKDLVKSRQERTDGHRLLTRVCLTATGWNKLGEESHGKPV